MRSDLTCFIAGQAAGHIYMLVVATGPNYVLVVWSTDGCITAALKAVVWGASQHLCNRRIVRALAFHQGRWGVRPSDRSRRSLRVWSISCIGKILIYFVPGRPVNSPPYYPSSGCHMATHFMIAHKAVPDGCRHLSLLLCVSRYQLAQL